MENEAVPAEAAEVVQEEVPAEEPKTEPTEEVAVPEIPAEPKKKSAQERIDEITRARREAEREREYWKKVALEREQREQQVQPPVVAPQGPARPTLDQFETTQQYEDALFDWRDRVRDLRSAEVAQRTAEETALQEFNRRAAKLRQENPDFDDVIEAPVFSPAMREVLLQSENGPEVAYFLGREENREQAERIRKMPAAKQAYEIGKLESNLLLAKKTKKVPGAPPPITPVGMGGGARTEEPDVNAPIEIWMAWEKQKTLDKMKAKYG